jgi:hypothetical protein
MPGVCWNAIEGIVRLAYFECTPRRKYLVMVSHETNRHETPGDETPRESSAPPAFFGGAMIALEAMEAAKFFASHLPRDASGLHASVRNWQSTVS